MADNVLPLEELGKRVCIDCHRLLPFSEFSPHPGFRLGVRSVCKSCASRRRMEWRDKNYDRDFDAHLRRKFGITLEQYNAMLAEQGGVCAICGDPPTIQSGISKGHKQGRQTKPRLVVDHDHATGKIRGLLCIPCNRGIGFLKDDPVIVRFALKYLEGGV